MRAVPTRALALEDPCAASASRAVKTGCARALIDINFTEFACETLATLARESVPPL
jgi:hypothetical protein